MKKSDYSGIIQVAQKIHKMINHNTLPKDPDELIALEKQMLREEAKRIRAKRARENIIYMRKIAKERKEYAKKMRRLELRWKIDRIHRLMQKFVERFKTTD